MVLQERAAPRRRAFKVNSDIICPSQVKLIHAKVVCQNLIRVNRAEGHLSSVVKPPAPVLLKSLGSLATFGRFFFCPSAKTKGPASWRGLPEPLLRSFFLNLNRPA
jgi:hypothetical protein